MQNNLHVHIHTLKLSCKRQTWKKKGGRNMPFGNGTGPAGMGPMTGRAAGYCAGYTMPGYANPVPGRGFWGRGGRGGVLSRRGAWFGAPYDYAPAYGVPQYNPRQNLDALKAQAQYLQQALEDIQKRIGELEES